MRRRNFIAGLASTTAAWPLAARAQRADQVRRIGVLMGWASTDLEGHALLTEFTRHLAELGWTEGRNVQIEVRWSASDVDLLHTFAKELIGLQPDVLLASSTPVTAALARETQTIPIVFTFVADPISSRFVASLSHPGGNLIGFSPIEASMTSKSLELLRELAPPHSITSSAVASSVGGKVKPSALAALRLITNSNLVASCTGSSPGFSPLRIRST